MTTATLPPSAWLLISGDAVSALGTGLVLPLTLRASRSTGSGPGPC